MATGTSTSPTATAPQEKPSLLRLAVVAQFAEAAGMLVATAYAAAGTVDGKSYHTSTGIEVTLMAFIAAIAIAGVAYATAKAKPWSRVPALIIQLFVIYGGVSLTEGNRLGWGVPALILAVVTIIGLLAPASLKALNRPS